MKLATQFLLTAGLGLSATSFAGDLEHTYPLDQMDVEALSDSVLFQDVVRQQVAMSQLRNALANGQAGPDEVRAAYNVQLEGDPEPVTVSFDKSQPEHAGYIGECRENVLGEAFAGARTVQDQNALVDCMADQYIENKQAARLQAGAVMIGGLILLLAAASTRNSNQPPFGPNPTTPP